MRSSYIPAERRRERRRRRREKKERERASSPGRAPLLLKNCRKKKALAHDKGGFSKKKGNVEGREKGKREEKVKKRRGRKGQGPNKERLGYLRRKRVHMIVKQLEYTNDIAMKTKLNN